MRASLAPALVLALVLLSGSAAALPADRALLGLATGETAALEALLAQQMQASAAAQLPRPPDLVYRDAVPVCDVNGDGARDLLVNNLTLSSPPSHSGAASELQAVSGRDGALLWKVDNLFAASMPAPAGIPYEMRGQAFPGASGTALPFLDLDADGTCDLLALGADSLGGYSVPLVGTPGVSNAVVSLRALSGRDGAEIWRIDFESTTVTADSPIFGYSQNRVSRNFLTGVLPFDTPAGPRVVTKATDMRYHYTQPGLVSIGLPTVTSQGETIRLPPEAEDVRITEHVQMRDARTGDLLWERVLGAESPSSEVDGRYTNLTWVAGVASLNGDDQPDVVLDQIVVTTPRTNEANHPVTGETLFRYGRGVRTTALDGAAGGTLWSTPILDPLAAEAPVAAEETFETLQWTRSMTMGDVDGDGVDEVLTSYVAREESLGTTVAGAYRTHFVPLSGANGTALWDIRQQGWGVARALDVAGTVRHIGLGMLDVPAQASTEGLFPPKFIRLLGIDAATGETRWSDERSFAQNSYLSYNLGLGQFEDTLAPNDWNADGVLDLVSAAQPAAKNGRDQVLLATSSHTYEVRSGADGALLGSARAWGVDGRVVPCAGSEGTLTVLSGHGRRLEVARFDPLTGERLWRAVLHNDPVPRAATTAMDVTGLGARCAETEDGRTLFGADLQAYSYERRHEVVPVLAALDEGEAQWLVPELRGSPPGDALFQASIDETPPSTSSRAGAAIGAVAVGGLAALATLAILVRRGSALLAAGMVLMLLAPGALALGAPLAALPGKAPDAAPAALGAPALAEQVRAVREQALAARDAEPSLTRFGDQDTVSYTLPVGDVDGDGFEDVVLDQYCLGADACFDSTYLPEDALDLLMNTCGERHDLVGVSGRDGAPTWALDLTINGPINSCGQNLVIGTFATSQGTAILVYRFQLVWSGINSEGVALHDISAILARDGSTLWNYSARGAYGTDWATTQTARDFMVVPILRDGALFLQGVGWIMSSSTSILPLVPGYPLTEGPVTTHDTHSPVEWAARIDLETGAELWRRDTFQPTPGLNQLPRAMNVFNLEYAWTYGFDVTDTLRWDARACCGDLTGDGVPELVYDVLEWGQTPNGRVVGPDALAARLVALDGATGEVHLDVLVAEGLPLTRGERLFRYNYAFLSYGTGIPSPVLYEPVGDADGDGKADILAHAYVRQPEFHQEMKLLSGATGEPLWAMESVRDLRALVLGDADGDGGSDFLLLDWYGHEGAPEKMDDFVTPRGNPITLHSGRTGEPLWRVTTYAAPADVLESYRAIQRNGRLDVDGDGVGDFFSDDPLYLDDQTVVHQITVLSGRDGAPLREHRTVGAFGIPASGGDADGDGRMEVAILSGDVNDLWLTVYDGASGEAEWSRRVLSLPSTGYAQALPRFQVHTLEQPGEDALAITMHLSVLRVSTWLGVCIGCAEGETGEFTEEITALLPQILRVEGDDGALSWAVPALDDVDELARTRGETPGAAAFGDVYARASAVGLLGLAGREAKPFALPVGLGFVLAYAAFLGGGIALVRFKNRFTGVPELE